MTLVYSLSYFRSTPFRRGRREPDAAQIELTRLKLAHEQLRRYAEDLRLAYEAERSRRLALTAELTQVTLELVSKRAAEDSAGSRSEEPAGATQKQAA